MFAPFVVGLVGLAIDEANAGPCKAEWCLPGAEGFAIGALVGNVAAVTIDAAVFAREPLLRVPEKRAHARWTPTLQVRTSGASAGVAGMF